VGDGVRTVVLAGSCSPATLAQVSAAAARWPAYRLDPRTDADANRAASWLARTIGTRPAVVYSSAPPADRDPALSGVVERAIGRLAQHAVAHGARRVVVAGGETAGAVVDALRIGSAIVGPDLAPGVPWLSTAGPPPLALLLKSGNFGGPDLLVRAAGGSGA
jgi:3-dehydrotetronate 4-kinase